jgi:hypothetical protein
VVVVVDVVLVVDEITAANEAGSGWCACVHAGAI